MAGTPGLPSIADFVPHVLYHIWVGRLLRAEVKGFAPSIGVLRVTSIVAKAERSEAATRKRTTGRSRGSPAGAQLPNLLADLATYSRIHATTALNEKYVFTLHTRPRTPV
jgi:hypothetical protein